MVSTTDHYKYNTPSTDFIEGIVVQHTKFRFCLKHRYRVSHDSSPQNPLVK